MKITPAHDFNDFEVGRRHDLPMPSVLDREARVTLAEIEDVLAAVDGVADPAFVRGAGRAGPVRRAQGDRGRTGTAGAAGEDRAAHASGAARRSRRRADRAAADDAVVLQRRGAGEAGDRGGGIRPHCSSCRSNGRTPSSPGCATSSRGAFRGNCGGGIGFRPGTGRTARCSSRTTRTKRRRLADAHYGRAGNVDAGRGRAGHVVQFRPVAVLHVGLAGARRRNWRVTIRATCW